MIKTRIIEKKKEKIMKSESLVDWIDKEFGEKDA